MLINLCENYFETQVKCDKPCTDGYDVNNLLSNNNSGFLSYSTIKPPINIDFNFICNIKLSHVLIWPCVGSQKSTGFKILTKFHNYFRPLSSGFLNENHMGILFSTKYFNKNTILIPKNFYNSSINYYHDNIVDHVDNLRITIIKTDKSVPGIGKIEIWGYVSSLNKLENSNRIFNILSKQINSYHQRHQSINNCNNDEIINQQSIKLSESSIIPEEYLDPITWTLMLQPIILPSGKIIDQSTLENYGENEALWGRPLSDPFTGISLNDNYKPIFAMQLKLKIDKFLSENADNLEIKQLPRTLGTRNSLNLPSFSTQNGRKLINIQSNITINKLNDRKKIIGHKLPSISRQHSRNIINKKTKIISIPKTELLKLENNETALEINCKIDDKLKNNLQNILSNLKRFNDIKELKNNDNLIEKNICNCCELPIYYKLPCNHIVCRKIILSYINNNNNNIYSQCPRCNFKYKSSEIIKIHI
ncbi:hypothetical protein PV327_010873 [Microctonus hyperodae]|uniref:U-box domain-containing protein n=1 Tax=Microctonus hyperodae TaxID=165561 RepID=A0AA39C8Z1_MICHY|nr:hypothetical protein PV327_010873 [Microctonus hyperodae]